jgi:hypothetical protein
VPLAAADTAAAADAAAAEASGTGDAAKTPAASKNAFSALMSSSKAVKETAAAASDIKDAADCGLPITSTDNSLPNQAPAPKNAFATLMQPIKTAFSKSASELDENGWEVSCHVCGKRLDKGEFVGTGRNCRRGEMRSSRVWGKSGFWLRRGGTALP